MSQFPCMWEVDKDRGGMKCQLWWSTRFSTSRVPAVERSLLLNPLPLTIKCSSQLVNSRRKKIWTWSIQSPPRLYVESEVRGNLIALRWLQKANQTHREPCWIWVAQTLPFVMCRHRRWATLLFKPHLSSNSEVVRNLQPPFFCRFLFSTWLLR